MADLKNSHDRTEVCAECESRECRDNARTLSDVRLENGDCARCETELRASEASRRTAEADNGLAGDDCVNDGGGGGVSGVTGDRGPMS